MQTAMSKIDALQWARKELVNAGRDTAPIDKALTSTAFEPHVPHALLDMMRILLECKSDRALASVLGMEPPVLSKIRRGRTVIPSASFIIHAHEMTDLSFDKIRELLGVAPDHRF